MNINRIYCLGITYLHHTLSHTNHENHPFWFFRKVSINSRWIIVPGTNALTLQWEINCFGVLRFFFFTGLSIRLACLCADKFHITRRADGGKRKIHSTLDGKNAKILCSHREILCRSTNYFNDENTTVFSVSQFLIAPFTQFSRKWEKFFQSKMMISICMPASSALQLMQNSTELAFGTKRSSYNLLLCATVKWIDVNALAPAEQGERAFIMISLATFSREMRARHRIAVTMWMAVKYYSTIVVRFWFSMETLTVFPSIAHIRIDRLAARNVCTNYENAFNVFTASIDANRGELSELWTMNGFVCADEQIWPQSFRIEHRLLSLVLCILMNSPLRAPFNCRKKNCAKDSNKKLRRHKSLLIKLIARMA